MGEVYKARDEKLRRFVAIKVLPDAFVPSVEARKRFEREALAVAALSHQNILAIFDFGEHDGRSYAVTEFLEGETLREKVRAGAMPVGLVLGYARQVVDGLAAAHDRGIVHRDLKPENVFVTRDGLVKILDFGLAKVVPVADDADAESTASALSRPGEVAGTIGYMSPEQVRSAAVDHRSDLFSFGTMLHEMLTGKNPFKRASSVETAAAILTQLPPALSDSGVRHPGVEQIVAHCLEKEPARRFQSARDLRLALAAVADTPVALLPSAPARSVWLKWAVLGVVLAAASAAGWRLARAGRLPVPAPAVAVASIAVLPFTNLSADKDQEFFSDGLAEELIGLLTRVQELHVVGRTSSFAFKGKADDMREIGRKLSVQSLLEGSVQRSGSRLRVATQLVNVSDGYEIWAETYDRDVNDVFAVQDDIAGRVVAALKVKLLPSDLPIVSQHRTSNTEAYNDFLLGRRFYWEASASSYRRAIKAFEGSIARDASYAPAYSGLAATLAQLADTTTDDAERRAIQERAVWAGEHAVELAPDLAEAYTARGNVRTYILRDWVGARSDFEKALMLDRNDVQTYAFYGRLLARVGSLSEAIAYERKATELEPLWPNPKNMLGMYLCANGDRREARVVLGRALEVAPGNTYARYFLNVTMLADGNAEEALAAAGDRETHFGGTIAAIALDRLGRHAESEEVLQHVIQSSRDAGPYHIALVFANRGALDAAFTWLDHAFEKRDPQLAIIRIDPLASNLRHDPRYAALLTKLHLPQ